VDIKTQRRFRSLNRVVQIRIHFSLL